MTSPSFELRPLDGFSGYRFIRPPVSDGTRLFGVQTDGVAVALERDGRVAWQRPATRPWPPLTSRVDAAVRGGALLVSDEEWTALELSTGAVRWHVEIESDLAGPAFDGDHVWAYRVDPRAHEKSLVRVSLDDGSTRTLRKAATWGEVLTVTHQAVIALEGDRFISVDRTGGAERWSLSLERPSCEHGRKQAIALQYGHRWGSRLLVPLMGYGFVAIDLDNGTVVWDADLQVVGMASVLAGDRLYLQSTWRFVELDAGTGAVLSDVEITDPAERRKTSAPGPLVHHAGVLYAANRDGTVFGWDIAARRLVWSHAVGTRVEWSCPPRIFLDALWIMDAEGALHPFALSDRR
jgi:hypothetical protein